MKIHVLHTDKPSILFYLNSTLRLEFSTVERKQKPTHLHH
jgi:hypothetical protein